MSLCLLRNKRRIFKYVVLRIQRLDFGNLATTATREHVTMQTSTIVTREKHDRPASGQSLEHFAWCREAVVLALP